MAHRFCGATASALSGISPFRGRVLEQGTRPGGAVKGHTLSDLSDHLFHRHGALVGNGAFPSACWATSALAGTVQHGGADVLRRCGGNTCAPRAADFETVMRGILAEYDAALGVAHPHAAFLGAAMRAARHRSARLSQQDSCRVQLLFHGDGARGAEKKAGPDTTCGVALAAADQTLPPKPGRAVPRRCFCI